MVFISPKRWGGTTAALTFSAFLALSPMAWSQTWTGTGGNFNWGNANNWNPATVPNDVSTATATFVSGVANLTAVLDANYSVASLVFNLSGGPSTGASSAFTINGTNTLTVGAGGITNNTDDAQTINANLSLAANATFSNTTPSGSLVLGGSTLDLGGNTLTVGGAGNTSIASTIGGSGSLTKTGGGTLTLTGANTYGGGTIVSAGYLNVGVIGGTGTTESIGTGAATISGTSFLNFYAGSSAGSNTITNNYGLSFLNTSTAGNSSITNNNGSSLFFRDMSTAGSSTITNNNGVYFYNTSNAGSSNITNNNGLYFYDTSTAGSSTITNNFASSFLNTSSAGNSSITNNNTVSFLNTSTAGSSTITNNTGALLDISGLTSGGISVGSLSGAGSVILGSKALTVGGLNTSDTISGVLSGSGGSLVKTGTGTLTLSGANTYSGGTTISAGSLVASGSALGTGAASIASGATLDVGQAVNTSGTALAGGAQTLSVSSLTVTSTSNTTTPALTFNLFGGGVSDTLTLTSTGTDLTFSSATSDKFLIGFASGTGSVLPYGQIYTLMTFTSPSASDVLGLDTTNANNSFAAKGVGNLASVNGTFSWTKNGSNQITSLQYNLTNDATTPEPGSLVLLLTGALPLAVFARRRKRSRCDGKPVPQP